jgi:hypothetical protein
VLGSVYLLLSMLWGGHFQIGYVWALPEGGYEFGVFWAVMIAVFAANDPLNHVTLHTHEFRDPHRIIAEHSPALAASTPKLLGRRCGRAR